MNMEKTGEACSENVMGARTEILLKAIDRNLIVPKIPMTIAYTGIEIMF